MKFIFFGTPEFAAIVLEELIDAGYLPAAIVTNPDEPVGRKKTLTSPLVKIMAEKFNIPILQPQKLRDNLKFVEQLKNLDSDLAIIAAYGKILPKEILDIPIHGFINIHPSLLPKYRGASPIQYAILNGDKETGVTIMEVDEEMDHGAIISKSKCQISNDDTYESLSRKLAILGAKFLIKIIPEYISGKIKTVPQKHEKATYTKIIKKEDGKIDWMKPAEEIERIVRAFYPWPTAYTYVNLKSQISNIKNINQNLKLFKIVESKIILQYVDVSKYSPGIIFLTSNKELAVKCGSGVLIIKRLQLEGGKVLSAQEFLNGHKDFIGSILE